MSKLLFFPLAVITSLLVSCSDTPREQSIPSVPATGAEGSLSAEINRLRSAAGKDLLRQSSELDALAASEASRLAARNSQQANISDLRQRAGFEKLAVLVGTLKDRGPSTGGDFPAYWMKDAQNKQYLLDDWDLAGVGTAKTNGGDLKSVVVFGGKDTSPR